MFDIDVDLSSLWIPLYRPGFNWVVVIARGLTLNRSFQVCREQFKVHSSWGNDPDGKIVENDRTSEGRSYAIRIHSNREPDEGLNGFSARGLQSQGTACITLLERLVAGLSYFKETNEHLDTAGTTLCSGSRASDGNVPNVRWGGFNGLFVHWSTSRSGGGPLCARAVVV